MANSLLFCLIKVDRSNDQIKHHVIVFVPSRGKERKGKDGNLYGMTAFHGFYIPDFFFVFFFLTGLYFYPREWKVSNTKWWKEIMDWKHIS